MRRSLEAAVETVEYDPLHETRADQRRFCRFFRGGIPWQRQFTVGLKSRVDVIGSRTSQSAMRTERKPTANQPTIRSARVRAEAEPRSQTGLAAGLSPGYHRGVWPARAGGRSNNAGEKPNRSARTTITTRRPSESWFCFPQKPPSWASRPMNYKKQCWPVAPRKGSVGHALFL